MEIPVILFVVLFAQAHPAITKKNSKEHVIAHRKCVCRTKYGDTVYLFFFCFVCHVYFADTTMAIFMEEETGPNDISRYDGNSRYQLWREALVSLGWGRQIT